MKTEGPRPSRRGGHLPNRKLVVIGTSAGGIEALKQLVGAISPGFPAPIAVVLHTSPHSPGVLHEILTRSGPLSGVSPRSGERLLPGRIYVAPPDFHLLIEPGVVRLTKGPRENRFRPAIDPLFRSAAQVYGPNAIGVILTGNLGDGTAGLWAIKQLGGVAVVQDPADAMFPSMPENAIRYVQADYVVPLTTIAALLESLVAIPAAAEPAAASPELDVEIRIAKEEDPITAGVIAMGQPSTFACPECHGVLMQMKEAGRLRFRCHTGHAYSAESLLTEISDQIETSLWNTIRSMQEGALLLHEFGSHAETSHQAGSGTPFLDRSKELMQQAAALREMVTASIDHEVREADAIPPTERTPQRMVDSRHPS
jgi:two-component system, chemotaxis family, protein-glutamate methylesterase/glutaminase